MDSFCFRILNNFTCEKGEFALLHIEYHCKYIGAFMEHNIFRSVSTTTRVRKVLYAILQSLEILCNYLETLE